MAAFDEYRDRYTCAALRREDGILEIRLHTGDGPLVWGEVPHRELPDLWVDVGRDPENRVVILTGTGADFCVDIDRRSWANSGLSTAQGYEKIHSEGRRLIQGLLEIDAPVVGALNGPARIHAELAVLGDIVLAADTAVIQDAAHFASGSVPGDGAHVVWPLLLGPNRGRYFLMTNEELSPQEAQRLGVVAEVMPAAELSARAWEHARRLITLPDLTLRYTRIALVQPLRRAMLEQLSHGLILEGSAIAAAAAAGARPS
jgi:enoyl-CoA hydratase/carnithine racemase